MGHVKRTNRKQKLSEKGLNLMVNITDKYQITKPPECIRINISQPKTIEFQIDDGVIIFSRDGIKRFLKWAKLNFDASSDTEIKDSIE